MKNKCNELMKNQWRIQLITNEWLMTFIHFIAWHNRYIPIHIRKLSRQVVESRIKKFVETYNFNPIKLARSLSELSAELNLVILISKRYSQNLCYSDIPAFLIKKNNEIFGMIIFFLKENSFVNFSRLSKRLI